MLATVIVGIKALHFGLLKHLALSGVHIQLEERIRRGHRRVTVAQPGRFRFRIEADPRNVGRIVECYPYHLARFTVDLPDTGQPPLALLHHQPVGKQREPFQHYLIPRGNEHLPLSLVAHFGFVEAEVFALAIRAQIKAVLEVIQTVLVIFATRQEAERLGIRQFGIQQQDFRGGGAGQKDNHVVTRGSFMQADIKRFILLFINQLVIGRVRAYGMAPHLIRQQRGGVLFNVVDRLGIVRPDEIRGDVFQHFRIPVAGFQIAKTQAVLATGEIILRQRHNDIVRRDGHTAQGIKLAVSCTLVSIQQNVPFIPLGA